MATTKRSRLQSIYFLEASDTPDLLMLREHGAVKQRVVGGVPGGDGTRFAYGRTVKGESRAWTVDVYESGQVTVTAGAKP